MAVMVFALVCLVVSAQSQDSSVVIDGDRRTLTEAEATAHKAIRDAASAVAVIDGISKASAEDAAEKALLGYLGRSHATRTGTTWPVTPEETAKVQAENMRNVAVETYMAFYELAAMSGKSSVEAGSIAGKAAYDVAVAVAIKTDKSSAHAKTVAAQTIYDAVFEALLEQREDDKLHGKWGGSTVDEMRIAAGKATYDAVSATYIEDAKSPVEASTIATKLTYDAVLTDAIREDESPKEAKKIASEVTFAIVSAVAKMNGKSAAEAAEFAGTAVAVASGKSGSTDVKTKKPSDGGNRRLLARSAFTGQSQGASASDRVVFV